MNMDIRSVRIEIAPGSIAVQTDIITLHARPVGRRSIAVRALTWPAVLDQPWNNHTLTFSLLDLLRCTTQYFFVESWLAKKSDGWVLGLPVVEYLAPGPELRWKARNSNVGRWLSEMAAVGLSCYLMEQCGAVRISLGDHGRRGPDYGCRICREKTRAGRDIEAWFECKGTSTARGLSTQVKRATKQIDRYKRGGRQTLGLICAACVPLADSSDKAYMCVADPPQQDQWDVAPFQYELASLAATLGWAGELETAHRLASIVLSLEEKVPSYVAPERARRALGEQRTRVLQALDRSLETARRGQRRILGDERGAGFNVVLPVTNMERLRACFEEGVDAVAGYRVESVRPPEQRPEEASFAPDGSGLVWEPGKEGQSEA